MIAWRVPLAAFLAGAALAGGAVGGVMYLRAQAVEAKHESVLSSVRANTAESALRQVGEFNKRVDEATVAVDALRKDQYENNQSLRAALAGLRSDTGGLRQHVANLHSRLEHAPASAVQRYASTCGRLLSELAAEGQAMADEGAGLALSAGGHLADDTRKRLSWPRVDPSRVVLAP